MRLGVCVSAFFIWEFYFIFPCAEVTPWRYYPRSAPRRIKSEVVVFNASLKNSIPNASVMVRKYGLVSVFKKSRPPRGSVTSMEYGMAVFKFSPIYPGVISHDPVFLSTPCRDGMNIAFCGV